MIEPNFGPNFDVSGDGVVLSQFYSSLKVRHHNYHHSVSQNHGGWKEPLEITQTSSIAKDDSLQQVTHVGVRRCLKYFQIKISYKLSGQSFPVFHNNGLESLSCTSLCNYALSRSFSLGLFLAYCYIWQQQNALCPLWSPAFTSFRLLWWAALPPSNLLLQRQHGGHSRDFPSFK